MRCLIFIQLLLFNLYAFNEGELFFDGNCVTCHCKLEKRSAPSIKEVREHYLRAFSEEKDFIDYMTNWVLKPNKETSLMSHSIEEFGLMPELAYDEYSLRKIAEYIYKTDFSKQP